MKERSLKDTVGWKVEKDSCDNGFDSVTTFIDCSHGKKKSVVFDLQENHKLLEFLRLEITLILLYC